MRKNILFICIIGIMLTVMVQVYRGPGTGDFLAYWSSAHIFVHGGNPYDQAAMIGLQQSITQNTAAQPDTLINAWNPPWLMLIFSLLGLLPFQSAIFLWTFINAFLIGLVLIFSWHMATNGKSSKGILAAFVAGYFFAITISYLVIGQVTVLVLIGVLASVWLLDKGQDRLSGIALILTIIKPHISYLFLIVLMVWVIKNHRWKVIEGFLLAVISSLVIFWIVDPSWITDYIGLIRKLPYTLTYTSTFGSFMASKFNMRVFYLSAILTLFFIKPLLQVQQKYGWLTTVNLALLISLPFSPYGFVFDQIVLLPAIVQIIAWVWNAGLSKIRIALVIGLMAALYLLVLYMLSIPILEYYWFFVIPLILLLIYLTTWRMSIRPSNTLGIMQLDQG